MNETIKLIAERKSVRVYEEREISPEDKKTILNAAVQAPSPGNMCLYSIINVTDKGVLKRLSQTCDNQPFIANSKFTLIFCADYRRWYKLFCRHNENCRKPDIGDLQLSQVDAVIAAQTAALAAESLGIGSCYIGDVNENFEQHRELLKLPKYVLPVCMLCMGYPTESQKKRQKPKRFKPEDIVFENGYDTDRDDDFERMLSRREGLKDEAFHDWVQRFCKRKWDSDFSVEMSRSCREMLNYWCE